MERKQYEIILGQAHNIISSKTDIDELLNNPEYAEKYAEKVKGMARIMVKTYKEVFQEKEV